MLGTRRKSRVRWDSQLKADPLAQVVHVWLFSAIAMLRIPGSGDVTWNVMLSVSIESKSKFRRKDSVSAVNSLDHGRQSCLVTQGTSDNESKNSLMTNYLHVGESDLWLYAVAHTAAVNFPSLACSCHAVQRVNQATAWVTSTVADPVQRRPVALLQLVASGALP